MCSLQSSPVSLSPQLKSFEKCCWLSGKTIPLKVSAKEHLIYANISKLASNSLIFPSLRDYRLLTESVCMKK